MQPISVFFDITKVADSQLTNNDVIRTQGLCHVIYIFFWIFLKEGVPSLIIIAYM